MRGSRRKAIAKALLGMGVAPSREAMKETKRAWVHRSRIAADAMSQLHPKKKAARPSFLGKLKKNFQGFRTSRNRTTVPWWGAPATVGHRPFRGHQRT